MLKYTLRVTIPMQEIVGGVVRYCDLVAKIKIAKFFPGVFVGDSRKFVLAKNFPLYGRIQRASLTTDLIQ